VWDIETGELRHELRGHSVEVWGVALSADNHLAISGGLDGTVRLWDLRAGGVERKTLRPDRPYERMDITRLGGITDVQRNAMFDLGAVSLPA
jgi:WD40 repeat protein